MKTILKRAAALLLSAAVLLPSALASEALGSRVYAYTLDICDGTTLTREVMWSASKSDLRTENYVTYTPNPSVSPKVSFGERVPSRQTVYSMAKSLETQGKRVLSGINGDYFVVATGDPLGLLVTDGVLRSSASYLSAIGFRADGTAVAGKPDLKLRANFSGYSLKISEINKVRSGAGYFLFTDDFGPNTMNTRDGVDIILSPTGTEGQAVTGADKTTPLTTSRSLGIGRLTPCVVEEIIDASGATAIPEGKFVLSISDGGGDWLLEVLSALQPGDEVDIEISSADTRWNDVDCAVGSMHHILSGGQVTEDQESGSAAPRTAVGVKADGSVVFYTIDGRQPGYSIGATTKMVAQRLAELGCTEGMLLDGGGSTSFLSTYPDKSASSAMNQPSEGTPRAVSNAIFLISNRSATGTPGSLYVTPRDLVLLGGASTQCAATALDTGWYPMSVLPGSVTWTAETGTVNASGVYTAPKKTGVYTVSAESGGVTGSTRITVYDTPDAIRLTNAATGKTVSSLDLTPGQTVDLNAQATMHTVPLKGDDTCFTWSADVGTVSQTGVVTAGQVTASGRLTISAGSHTASIPFNVTANPRIRLLADFEDTGDPAGDLYFSKGTGARSEFAFSNEAKFGFRSLRWDYSPADSGATMTLEEPAVLTDADGYLSLWVCGDGSGNVLYAFFPRENGSLAAETTKLNFTGWKRLTFGTPADAMAFSGFKVMGDKDGSLLLDQIVLSNQSAPETTAPSVSLTVQGASVTARISDGTAASLSPRQVSLTLDGKRVPFTYSNGILTAALPALGTGSHQVAVTASDACGNLSRASQTITGSAPCPFTDMTGHWAAPYVSRLAEAGVVTGTGNGRFSPNSPVTRGDFALMSARWLGLDLNAYSALPFADADAIPDWDRAAVAALSELGIMQGSAGQGGKVYANARASLTRAEAFTLLSRMQAKGWPEASLAAFSDAGAIPAWARSSVASLVGQKVVSGAYGQLRPNDPVSRAEVCKLLMAMW